jgi:hypothetical protein
MQGWPNSELKLPLVALTIASMNLMVSERARFCFLFIKKD